MALAQLITQVPGTLIKSGDWNNEFQNILLHPISLISPTTGTINFNLQAHTNLLPATITATGGSAGQALISTGGATVSFGSPTVNSSGVTIVAGSTGQVFAVTSSNSAPAFQVLPIDGGLSSFSPTAGMTYFVGTSAVVLKGLTIGTSGQVYMTGTSGAPIWSNLTTGGSGGGGGGFASTTVTWTENFPNIITTATLPVTKSGSGFQYVDRGNSGMSGVTLSTYQNGAAGGIYFPVAAGEPDGLTRVTSTGGISFIFTSTMNIVMNVSAGMRSAGATSRMRVGLFSNLLTSLVPEPNDGMYIRSSGQTGSTNYRFVSRVGGLEFLINSGVVISSGVNTFTWTFANGATNPTCSVSANGGASLGTFTSSQVTTSTMGFAFGSSDGINDGILQGWQISMDRSTGGV